MDSIRSKTQKDTLRLRTPSATDGAKVWDLVRSCKPLDENSMYCNIIQCDHFAETCVVAELNGKMVGWISAYLVPSDPDTLFVWQVAVVPEARGHGVGVRMLKDILDRDVTSDVERLHTTITDDNDASWALFRKFSRVSGGDLTSKSHYTKDQHFQDCHSSENLVIIELPEALARAA
ncbi:MAG: diaminobutyrate acetyltransferase [Pseudomonadota bacterium]|nr:diaminobutyrate acetyltransferase [Pseudomonadota bacterium]